MKNNKLVTNEVLFQKLEEIDRKITALEEPLRPEDAAKFLGLSLGTVYNLVSSGDLPHYKKGKLCFLYRRDLNNWIKQGDTTTC